jgi:CRP-like cAMP-binding protein
MEWLSENKNVYTVPKGQFIFQEGSLVHGVYFIYHGKVKVISTNQEGKSHTVRLASDGHVLGHMSLDKELYAIGAVALETSQICFVENEIFYHTFVTNPDFALQAMMFYSRELRKSEMRTKCFAQMSTEEKIIYALIYITETFGLDRQKRIEINLGRQEIADIAGTNAEQVSRSITQLKEKKIITLENKDIIISDFKALKQRLSRYFSSEIFN